MFVKINDFEDFGVNSSLIININMINDISPRFAETNEGRFIQNGWVISMNNNNKYYITDKQYSDLYEIMRY